MQNEGTIPDPDITDALNSGLDFSETLVAGYQPNNGTNGVLASVDIYSKKGKPTFVHMFDTELGCPVAKQADAVIGALLKGRPSYRLEECFWAYENRTVPDSVNVLFYFFRVQLTKTGFSRLPAGQLPRKYMQVLLRK